MRCQRRAVLAAASWDSLDRQMAQMDASMQRAMDSAFDFSSISRFDREMDRQMRLMDEQMNVMQRQMDADMERSMRQLQQAPAGVHIERSEQHSATSHRYYESITVRSGAPVAPLKPTHAAAPSLFSPVVIAAVLLAGVWAAITAMFNKNYGLTTYSGGSRLKLTLLWPFLLAFSPSFRHQFVSALRGIPYSPKDDPQMQQ